MHLSENNAALRHSLPTPPLIPRAARLVSEKPARRLRASRVSSDQRDLAFRAGINEKGRPSGAARSKYNTVRPL
ncbi:hypothetical protein MCP1_100093 [Candidatus Terasakiella magnetica]|nr:hypothetical protein MCP1_100093 [Candidatus Terasakiella magnetica]